MPVIPITRQKYLDAVERVEMGIATPKDYAYLDETLSREFSGEGTCATIYDDVEELTWKRKRRWVRPAAYLALLAALALLLWMISSGWMERAWREATR